MKFYHVSHYIMLKVIVNLYEEILYHDNENEKSLIKQVIHQSLEDKSCKRGVDYRASLSKCVILLQNKIDDDLLNILETVYEIQDQMYTSEENRTMDKMLCLHNQTFLHVLFLKKIIKSNPLSYIKCKNILW